MVRIAHNLLKIMFHWIQINYIEPIGKSIVKDRENITHLVINRKSNQHQSNDLEIINTPHWKETYPLSTH